MQQLFRMAMGATALVALAGPVAAQNITFESDAAGSKPNGWMSNESADVLFSDSDGSGLHVANFGHHGFGNALAVFGDDRSELVMDFVRPMSFLELWFGNDDPGWIQPGASAILTVFMDAMQVGQAIVPVNANDVMDQAIRFDGNIFNRATFAYDAALAEVVDDISYRPAEQVVPEPISMALLGTGLAGVGAVRRRRNRKDEA